VILPYLRVISSQFDVIVPSKFVNMVSFLSLSISYSTFFTQLCFTLSVISLQQAQERAKQLAAQMAMAEAAAAEKKNGGIGGIGGNKGLMMRKSFVLDVYIICA